MRAPIPYLLALLLAATSCGKHAEAPPTLNSAPASDGPAGGAGGTPKVDPTSGEDQEPTSDKPQAMAAAPVVMDPNGTFAPLTPEPMPKPREIGNAATTTPTMPMGGNGPVVALNRNEATIELPPAPPEAPADPADPADRLKAAIDGGWRDNRILAKGEPGSADDEGQAGAAGDLPEEPAKTTGRDDNARRATTDAKAGLIDGFARFADEEAKEEEEAEKKPEVTKGKEKDDDGERAAMGRKEAKRLPRGAFTLRLRGEDPDLFVPPTSTLPRMFYFENTYLGGSAAYAERLRRLDQALAGEDRPYEVAQAEVQPFDEPRSDGLALTASVDATHIEKARRVFLQVGIRGSSRFGWRRPPLDIVLVVDQPAFARGPAFVTAFLVDLLRRLGPADRLGIVLAGDEARTFLELGRLNSIRQHLANQIDELAAPTAGGARDLASAMQKAGDLLARASDDEATVPGTKTLMVLSGEHDQGRIAEAAGAAHQLTVQGCVTSVFALDAERSDWWQVANAGYGNLHRITDKAFAPSIDEEMKSLARVVARLVRVNVRLGKEAKAIRVLGTRVLEQREVEEVKARELATDRNLSKSLGIISDRGEDDDGIQTVIPYFYGDDSHIILIELWVEGPGTVADVTLRYKDMVNLDNATARTSVRLGARPQAPTQEQVLIAHNVRGFELAENLQRASDAVFHNDLGTAVKSLGAASSMAAETNALDQQAVESLKAMVERGDWQSDAGRRATVQETLLISGQRRVGDTNKRK